MRVMTFGQLTQIGRRLVGRASSSRPLDPREQVKVTFPTGGSAVFDYCRATSRHDVAVYRSSHPAAAGFIVEIERSV
jgi:hypothetical protein